MENNKITKTIRLPYFAAYLLLEFFAENPDLHTYLNEKKHKLILEDSEYKKVLDFRLPLPFPAIEVEEKLLKYFPKTSPETPPYLIILMQAGNAALGYFEEGEVVEHKVIRKYMVRKKQGKAQITYLHKKGKSRAGSRVRLADTMQFFEDINQKLIDWDDFEGIFENTERVLYSCPPRLWGMLFNAKTPPPFERNDPKYIKIPLDVSVPIFDELLATNELSLAGEVNFYGKVDESVVQKIIDLQKLYF
jgi:hypothetical protein